MLRTVDTDIVVVAIAFFHELPLSELWVAFGVGKHLRYVPVHVIASSMGQQKLKALLAFHSFTGCNQTSSFASIGKKKAWEAWAIYDEVTEVFQSLSAAPTISAVSDAIPVLQRFTVLMYDRTSSCTTVNAARKDLFTRKGRNIESIPPTADALLQHTESNIPGWSLLGKVLGSITSTSSSK
mgnify:CR=1 FL=1